MELTDYLRIVRRHWRTILACVLVAVLLASVYTLMRPKVYQAQAAGFVASQGGNSAAESSINDSLAKSRTPSYIVVAKSRGTAEAAAKIIGTDESASALIGRVSVVQPPDTVLIQVTAEGATPESATELANAWIQALAKEVEGIEGTGKGAMRVVPQESAEMPSAPVQPNPRRDVPLALIVGLLIGLGIAVLQAQLDRRIRTPEDVRALDLTVLSSIPGTKALDRSGGRIPLLTAARGAALDPAASEAIRRLRTNLRYMNVDDPPRVIVVTSPNEGDGKSTVASNLAATMATSGQSTVLIDADLRRPVIAAGFGVAEGAGLTDVLTGEADVDDVMQESGQIDGLYVVGAGNLPPNPSELLVARYASTRHWARGRPPAHHRRAACAAGHGRGGALDDRRRRHPRRLRRQDTRHPCPGRCRATRGGQRASPRGGAQPARQARGRRLLRRTHQVPRHPGDPQGGCATAADQAKPGLEVPDRPRDLAAPRRQVVGPLGDLTSVV